LYRTIDTSIWHDPKIRDLSPEGKLLAVYLFANDQSHVSGLYFFRKSSAIEDLCIKSSRFDESFASLCKSGFCKWDAENRIIWVVNMLKRQRPNPKILTSVARHLESLHHSPLIPLFLERYSHLKIAYRYPIDTIPKKFGRTGSEEQDQYVQEQNNPPTPLMGADGGDESISGNGKPKKKKTSLPLLKAPDELATKMNELEISTLPSIRDTFEPMGLDVDAWWKNFRKYSIQGSAKKPYPNPSNWKDWPAAMRDSCESAIAKGMYARIGHQQISPADKFLEREDEEI
jgi:hypothetical protein